MRLRKRGRNEYYAKPNRPNTGTDRSSHEYMGHRSVWGPVGITLLLVLHIHIVLVVFGQHRVSANVQEGKKKLSLQKGGKKKE